MPDMIGDMDRLPRIRIEGWAIPGLPEITAATDLPLLLGDALEQAARVRPADALRDGDVLVVTSKIISKAEGRFMKASHREDAITIETVRTVATRGTVHGRGGTRIVENRLGIVAAAAGVDASNTPEGTVLLLPENPDESARRLCGYLRVRFGVTVGVIITDTLGRAWRVGQTDAAIGAAGVEVLEDLRGQTDAQGRVLAVTEPAVADEIASMADLIKGKSSGTPVAVVRGLRHLVTPAFGTGARILNRDADSDMFRLGTDEALAEGYRRAQAGEPLQP